MSDIRFEFQTSVNLDDDIRSSLEAKFGKLRVAWSPDLEKLTIRAIPSIVHENCAEIFMECVNQAFGDDRKFYYTDGTAGKSRHIQPLGMIWPSDSLTRCNRR